MPASSAQPASAAGGSSGGRSGRRRGRHRGGAADMHLFSPAHPRHVFVFRRALVYNAEHVRPDAGLGVPLVCASFLEAGKCHHGPHHGPHHRQYQQQQAHPDERPAGDHACPHAHVDGLEAASAVHVPHVKNEVGAASLGPGWQPGERQARYTEQQVAGPITATLPNSSRAAPPIRAGDCLVTRALDGLAPPAAAAQPGAAQPGADDARPAPPPGVSICAHFLLHDRCNLGRDCRYLHVLNDAAIRGAVRAGTAERGSPAAAVGAASTSTLATASFPTISGSALVGQASFPGVSSFASLSANAAPYAGPTPKRHSAAGRETSLPVVGLTAAGHFNTSATILLRFRHDPYAATLTTGTGSPTAGAGSGWQQGKAKPARRSPADPSYPREAPDM